MSEWKRALIKQETSIIEALRVLDSSAMQILIVTDNENRLLGTVTDGDVRRGILDGFSLESPVFRVMNRNPVTAKASSPREHILALMKKRRLHQIPLVDDNGRVCGVQVVEDLLRNMEKENWVVLMAGGLGTRLRPLTDECPKPLIRIGDKPVLELILEKLIEAGFGKFYISVNYQAKKIKDYFQDGHRWAVNIQYIEENKKLGTAGCLGLISDRPVEPLLVMNGDLLTGINYDVLLAFHLENHSAATMCVREYKVQVPFGVVKVERHRFTSIVEKPVERFFINAGVYVLNPNVLDLIEKEKYLDMPELFERIAGSGKETTVFPLHEEWLDIGRLDDLEKAHRIINGEKPL